MPFQAIYDACLLYPFEVVLDFSPTLFLRHFRKRAEQRRFWAQKNGKATHSDIEIAEHLKVVHGNDPGRNDPQSAR